MSAAEAENQLVPDAVLKSADKILFIAHLALGDFTYLQNCFEAFAATWPHAELHLWVDEVRRTGDAAQWPHLKRYSLYDWVEACPMFSRIYRETYSPQLYRESIAAARNEGYTLVVSLATLRPHRYARLARDIAPRGFVAGMRSDARWFQPGRRAAYRLLDAALDMAEAVCAVAKEGEPHISAVYAQWFHRLFGLRLPPAARFPHVDIPSRWTADAQRTLSHWRKGKPSAKAVFVNPYAKTPKRCWPLENVAELIRRMSTEPSWKGACFVVNATPQELQAARSVLEGQNLEHTHLFTAEENFFQLPAMLACCDLVISVETAVMHLANAVHVPVVALMRQKNPEWAPIDSANSIVVTAPRRRDWVKAISVEHVMQVLPQAPDRESNADRNQ